jgi:hypothetical protein
LPGLTDLKVIRENEVHDEKQLRPRISTLHGVRISEATRKETGRIQIELFVDINATETVRIELHDEKRDKPKPVGFRNAIAHENSSRPRITPSPGEEPKCAGRSEFSGAWHKGANQGWSLITGEDRLTSRGRQGSIATQRYPFL